MFVRKPYPERTSVTATKNGKTDVRFSKTYISSQYPHISVFV